MNLSAPAGFGIVYVPEEPAQSHLAMGRHKQVPEDRRPPFARRHLFYYPSRRQPTPAFALPV